MVALKKKSWYEDFDNSGGRVKTIDCMITLIQCV